MAHETPADCAFNSRFLGFVAALLHLLQPRCFKSSTHGSSVELWYCTWYYRLIFLVALTFSVIQKIKQYQNIKKIEREHDNPLGEGHSVLAGLY